MIADTPVTPINREYVQDIFYRHVLAALDKASRETFDPPRSDAGATYADLPRLFKAIDAQIDVLAERFDYALVEHVT